MNQRIECVFWAVVAVLLLLWVQLFAQDSMVPMLLFGMLAFAGYDFYQQAKETSALKIASTPLPDADYPLSATPQMPEGMSANRFFALQAIVFLLALTGLDFATALTGLVFFNGALWLVYRFKCRGVANELLPGWADVAQNYAALLLFVWVLRSFIIQPYHVPTGSLEPTLLPHELILVKQYQYGVRFPGWPWYSGVMKSVGKPQRGDIALFRYPENERVLLIKRVIGLPGDHIEYKNKQLFVNGKPCAQQAVPLEESMAIDNVPHRYHQDMFWEDLAGAKNHLIYRTPAMPMMAEQTSWDVPEGMYFMMGDNRDNSHDSRFWGFVPEKLLIGKGWLVFFSWDHQHHVRWHRIGSKL